MPRLLIAVLCVLLIGRSVAQDDSLAQRPSPGRKVIVAGTSLVVAGGSLVYLNQTWYNEYNTGRFHFFDDNAEWLQMDKAGHLYSGYQTSRLMMEAFRWAGISQRQTRWVGGTLGFVYLSVIEVMDGFSRGWGYSWGDQAANLAGTTLAITQDIAWSEQKLLVKFSYYPSDIARYNPELLGETPYTRILKDYNAQVYWLSFSPFLFVQRDSRFPRWLNVALGYGAYGMTGGHYNPANIRDGHGNVVAFERERLFFLSLDIDLTRIRTRSRALKTLFSALNVLKIPAPAIAVGNKGLRFCPLR